MSIDPLGAVAAGNADLAALIDSELAQLAADAQALRGLLVENAVVTARVMPSNGLTDLLEIAGRRVAASLPPTVRPGDALQVRVAGFDGDRILLQIVDTGANAAVETGPPNVPLVPSPGAFVAASIVPANPYAATSVPGPLATPVPPAATTPVATAREEAVPVVIASVSEEAAAVALVTTTEELPPAVRSMPTPGVEFSAAVLRANVAPQTLEVAARTQPVTPATPPPRPQIIVAPEPTTIEARMAAARATVAPSSTTPAPSLRASTLGAPLRTPVPVAPPAISPRANATAAAPGLAGAVPSAPRTSGLSAYTEPVALLRALRLPVTPSNLAAATTALQRPNALPAALTVLERALPNAAGNPQIATLRALVAFVGRIDPQSPVLASQIAAYVDHVVDGAEPKLATLLAATRAATTRDPDEPSSSNAPNVQSLSASVAAERSAALTVDLKQTLLAVASDPSTPAAVAPSLAGALTALTAVQLSAAQTLAANPDGIAFSLPLATPYGTTNAYISVKRDGPQARGVPLDPANFRIAFVLETMHYGTVAIDLVTVGRDVTVDVRTEAAPAMRAFRDALDGLTSRLEALRYRVASAGASVGTVSTLAIEAPPSQPVDPLAVVDRSA
jgi:hypothetical protein